MNYTEIEAYENLFPKGTIVDGVVDAERYLNSSPKIAWFLKEAYTGEDEGWHIKEHYAQEDAYQNFFRNVATPTWHPIIYVSYGILNGYKLWHSMPYIREKIDMCDVVKSIAIINANKSPSKTGTYTTWRNLSDGFEQFKELIQTQVDVLQPDIHIFCNTFHLYKSVFGLTDKHRVTVNPDFVKCDAWIKDGKMYIDVYHPSNRSQKRAIYVNQIIETAKFWSAEAVAI